MLISLITLLLLCTCGFHTVKPSQNECPALEDIFPCHCVSDGTNIRIDCIQVSSIEDIRKPLQNLIGIRNVYIDFLRSNFKKVPSDLFKGLHITRLSFTNCKLDSIGDEGRSALEGLEDIIQEFSVHFSIYDEHELKFLNLSRLDALEDIEIEGNDLFRLENDWFENGPPNVRNLFIMTNFIEVLGDKAFAALLNLRNLWLTGNRFKTLRRSMFPNPAIELTSLDLTDNEIMSLPEDMFLHMPSLKEVILADNGIQQVSETIWSPVWKQLTRVYLEENPLVCDSRIEWMFKYDRPYVLKGQCIAPEERKHVFLKRLIEDNRLEEGDFK